MLAKTDSGFIDMGDDDVMDDTVFYSDEDVKEYLEWALGDTVKLIGWLRIELENALMEVNRKMELEKLGVPYETEKNRITLRW